MMSPWMRINVVTYRSLVPVTTVALSVLLLSGNINVVLADAAEGKILFSQCSACHAVGEGAAHRFGPQLNGVLVRGAGVAEDYEYSLALTDRVEAGLDWDDGTLGEYLKAPMSYIPDTKMAFPGIASADERTSIIAYLKTIGLDGTGYDELETLSSNVTESGVASDTEPRPLAKDIPIPDHGILHLGRPALEAEIAAWDIDIRPDGVGLPAGEGNALHGGELYDAQCSACHGVFGEGEGRWPILAGGQDSLTDERPEKTVGSYWPYLSTVYDYVRRAMPFGNVRSLSDDDVYALTAYILYLNDMVDESFELSSSNFTFIKMPNEVNFIADNRSAESWFEMEGEPCMNNCIDGVATVSQRARVLDVTPDIDNDALTREHN